MNPARPPAALVVCASCAFVAGVARAGRLLIGLLSVGTNPLDATSTTWPQIFHQPSRSEGNMAACPAGAALASYRGAEFVGRRRNAKKDGSRLHSH